MISWRYHVVSIVAVILAFGLGILAGTSVVGDRFVRDLEKNYNEARQERDAALQLVEFYEGVAVQLQPTLRDGVLVGERAIVVTMDGVDGQASRVVEELTAAGAEVLATLRVTRSLVETDVEENAAVVERILGVPGSDPDDLRSDVTDALAVRLAFGPVDEQDVLEAFLEEGLVTADRDLDEEDLLAVGGPGQLVVIAAGGRAPAVAPEPELFLMPFAARLVQLDVTAAAVGPTEDAYGFVAAVREENEIPDCSMVTVDDVDLAIGAIALAMGLERLLDDPDPAFRAGGDYGVDGDSIVPGADEPPDSCRT
ncbi:MAG: copper transporter [Actinomycetota bacterium]